MKEELINDILRALRIFKLINCLVLWVFTVVLEVFDE